MVIAKRMEPLVAGSSIIRKLFEEGKEMAKKWALRMSMITAWAIQVFRHLTLSNRRLSKLLDTEDPLLCMVI